MTVIGFTDRSLGFWVLLSTIACVAVGCSGSETGGERGGFKPPDAGADAPLVTPDAGEPDVVPDAGQSDAAPDVEPPEDCSEVACHALATCDDASGRAVCSCLSGYTGDGLRACTDVDECAAGTHDCAAQASCTNTAGGFTCVCNAGYAGSGRQCDDVDECADPSANDCHANALCTNSAGSFSCACKPGFRGDGTACADIDECTENSHDCGTGSTCENNAGGFVCRCAAGFEARNGQCIDKCVLAMQERCDAVASCTIVANEARCACPSTHTDITGDGSQCVINASCTGACSDANAICVQDSPTAVHCECKTGFRDVNGDGTLCQDINECAASPCNANATCQNTPGGFTCQCNSGFTGDGFICSNVNECTSGTHNCDPNATCADRTPGFTCTCKTGWQGNGQSCTDVNECTQGTHNCHANANCTNTQGGFSCACKPGFTGDGRTSCVDVNECTLGTHNCHANATCTNTSGGFSCACKLGYQGDGTTSCTNANECALGTHDCNANATCTDRDPPERFQCACNFGYTGDGRSCTLQFCDLNGTWAVRTRTTLSWSDVRVSGFVVLQGDTFTSDVWELRRITYDGQTVTNEAKPCGSTYADAKNPTLNETYGVFIPNTRWDGLPFREPFTDPVANAKPGSAYVSSLRAELFGIKLPDPFGPWPLRAADVPVLCNAPGATPPCWSDDDDDTFTAVTTWSRPPTQRSPVYNQNYSYPPAGPQIIISRRVGCQQLAARTITRFNGSVVDCNTIKGAMEVTSTNSRLHSCRLSPNNTSVVDCNSTTLTACTATEARELDVSLNDLNQRVDRATFAMVRVADNANCAAVRSAAYPPE